MARPLSLTNATIKALAAARGFPLAGVIPARASESHAFYTAWLAAGFAGEMAYLHRHADLKQHPARLEQGARTMVMLGYPYHGESAIQAARPGPLTGRISRYARGRDYHEVIREKLIALGGELSLQAGRPIGARPFVDSAPVMEREHAARAGLGWVGRNAMLIHWRLGSWFFLAGLLLDLALPEGEYDNPPPAGNRALPAHPDPEPAPGMPAPADLPWRESCGTCTACIQACPTGAIVAGKTVDARRCISYLTIELKGPVPHDLRRGLGDWVFGCDICQDVCPWNRKAPAVSESSVFEKRGLENRASAVPDPEEATPDLAGLLALDDEGFRRRFRHTPLWRAKRRGILRNAALVLGNEARNGTEARMRAALPALLGALDDPEPLVRGAAAWALGQLPGEAPRDALTERLTHEEDPTVREELRLASKA